MDEQAKKRREVAPETGGNRTSTTKGAQQSWSDDISTSTSSDSSDDDEIEEDGDHGEDESDTNLGRLVRSDDEKSPEPSKAQAIHTPPGTQSRSATLLPGSGTIPRASRESLLSKGKSRTTEEEISKVGKASNAIQSAGNGAQIIQTVKITPLANLEEDKVKAWVETTTQLSGDTLPAIWLPHLTRTVQQQLDWMGDNPKGAWAGWEKWSLGRLRKTLEEEILRTRSDTFATNWPEAFSGATFNLHP